MDNFLSRFLLFSLTGSLLLLQFVAGVAGQEWNTIAHSFLKDSRTGTQCATHWKMVLKPALLKGVWSPEEDAVIYDSIARGVHDWSEVASLLPKRKAKHCRERWNNHLDPALNSGAWSPAEEAKLVGAVETHGTNWNVVARMIPGRSESMIQQHWNAIVFRNATSTDSARRSRTRTDGMSGPVAALGGGRGGGVGLKGRTKPSSLPVETSLQLSGQDLILREEDPARGGGVRVNGHTSMPDLGRPEQAVTLTDREKALMDHAFKTGLSAAGGGAGPRAGGGGGGVSPSTSDLMGAMSKGGGIDSLTLSTDDDDIFAPLTAALLKGEGSGDYSPTHMPPPSPTASPLKLHKQLPDYNAIGDQLGDVWAVDEDPAMADLYRSLDNIGESLFNEDTFELSFDFDSVDKPAPSCSGGSGGGGGGHTPPNCSSSRLWDNPLTKQEKVESPFRRAAAKAAANLEQRLSPLKRSSQTKGQQGRGIEEACARAAAAAAASAAAQSAAATVAPSSSGSASGPRVKQGLLRRLFSTDTKPGKHSRAPFTTVRGCLSEANAPPQPPPSPLPPIRPNSPADRELSGNDNGGRKGENQAPRRPYQPLSIALFAPRSSSPSAGGSADHNGGAGGAITPTLKHGKAEVKVPLPHASGLGVPLGSLPANRLK